MKSLEEIQEMLLAELCNSLDKIRINSNLEYYNEILGDSSFLLARFLELQLQLNSVNWDSKKWIDDSLLTNVVLENDVLFIVGVIIFGKQNTTAQWTEPFCFELKFNQDFTDFIQLAFFYSDIETVALSYVEFNRNRKFWNKEYFINNKWNPLIRNWKYIITCKKNPLCTHLFEG
jgi:hypothetical protein